MNQLSTCRTTDVVRLKRANLRLKLVLVLMVLLYALALIKPTQSKQGVKSIKATGVYNIIGSERNIIYQSGNGYNSINIGNGNVFNYEAVENDG